tara:strand:- start:129 stop:353 length:225 start_codon:yes stop_codon:yes gene_type:complete
LQALIKKIKKKNIFNNLYKKGILELMHDQKKRLLSTVNSYIGKGIQHTSRQSASWLYNGLCPIAEIFWGGLQRN